jgi:copper chaperone CopZ
MSGETLTLRVPGMYCPKCEERMAMALDRLPGIALLRADHVREEIELRVAGDRAPLAEVRRRIEALGFRIEPESELATPSRANATG